MKRFKRILKRVFFLPPLPTVLIALPSFTLCFYLLAEETDSIIAYVSYFMSAYSLTITITGFKGIVRAVLSGIKNCPAVKKVLRIKPVGKFVEDVKFRTKISLYFGFSVNLLYIAINLFSGIYYRSAWFAALAFYYILLAVMRFSLLKYVRRNNVGSNIRAELKRYRLCGIILLMMNQALAGIVAFIVNENRGFEYAGLLIYAMAAYTFYITIIAVVNIVKYRRHGSPVLSAAKAVNFVAAIVSMLSLTTAMLSSFGSADDFEFRRTMTAAVGTSVCVIVLGTAIFMIIRSTIRLKSLKTEVSENMQ